MVGELKLDAGRHRDVDVCGLINDEAAAAAAHAGEHDVAAEVSIAWAAPGGTGEVVYYLCNRAVHARADSDCAVCKAVGRLVRTRSTSWSGGTAANTWFATLAAVVATSLAVIRCGGVGGLVVRGRCRLRRHSAVLAGRADELRAGRRP